MFSNRLGRFALSAVLSTILMASTVLAQAANPKVAIQFAGKGRVVLELYPKLAPKTVEHFLDLVKKKFYNGIKVHRYVAGFVVQMGDPVSKNLSPAEFDAKGVGSHGSGTTVPLEADMPQKQGTVGLARAGDPNSGDSQFYFNLANNDQLDGQYCAFAKVISGMNVVQKLRVGDRIVSAELLGLARTRKHPARKEPSHKVK